MTYENVIPNLECAKLCTYYHNQHEIAMLTSNFDPNKYTKFFIRKDYDDGIYPKRFFLPNCDYGGKAFTPDKYSPLPPAIEKTIPNMHLYDKYKSHFGHTATSKMQIGNILKCAHIRLSTDGYTPKTENQLIRILNTGKYKGIIFHDYNLASIPNAYDIISNLSNTRHFVTKEGINPYRIGNKFPIQVNSSKELENWLKIQCMSDVFFLEYNGVMSNETLYNLCLENKRMAKQVYYHIDADSKDEIDFFKNALPKVFLQVLFLRKAGIKILLKYNKEKIVTYEIQRFIDLLNCWLSFYWHENFLPTTQSLFAFCQGNKKLHFSTWAFLTVDVSVDEMRDSFQYIRENNYELFRKFYEWDSVLYRNGEFIDEWGRN